MGAQAVALAKELGADHTVLAKEDGSHVAEMGADLPVLRDNTDFQVVPTYRIRAGFSVRF